MLHADWRRVSHTACCLEDTSTYFHADWRTLYLRPLRHSRGVNMSSNGILINTLRPLTFSTDVKSCMRWMVTQKDLRMPGTVGFFTRLCCFITQLVLFKLNQL